MPTFCRHGRLQATCPICSRQAASGRPPRPPRPARPRVAAPRAPRASSGVRVSRLQRAPEDGYDNWLVGGLRSSADAARLADELAFSAARLDELGSEPPGLYGAAAASADREEALWLAFLTAYVGPGRGGDPWSEIERVRVGWRGGALPALHDVRGGPRTGHDPRRGTTVLEAYRAWAARHGGQETALLGEPDWGPTRRFQRTFERLALPGLGRGAKYEFLVSAGALGLVALEAATLAVGRDALDPAISAAKRVLGIGDAISLERRATELARETGVPFGALDLAFFNLDRPEGERATMGSRAAADPARRAAIAAALGV